MKNYKLFFEGFKSNFNDYQAKIGINEADNPAYGLCFAEGWKILDYYQDHGFLISEVRKVEGYEFEQAQLDRKIGEASSLKIDLSEPEIVFDKKILKELDKEDALNQIYSKTNFICDIIHYRNKEIDCGFKLNGTKNIKTFNYKETLDYLLYEKEWLKDIEWEDVAEFCVKENDIEMLKELKDIVKNIDYTSALKEAYSTNNKEIKNYIINNKNIYSIFDAAKENNELTKWEIIMKMTEHPIKSVLSMIKHNEIEKNKYFFKRLDYEFNER